jgi:hypothetical protein
MKINNKVIDETKIEGVNPVDWYNFNADWNYVLGLHEWIQDDAFENKKIFKNDVVFYDSYLIIKKTKGGFPQTNLLWDTPYTKFHFLAMHYKNNFEQAYNYVLHKMMNKKLPFIRVATDYFKITTEYDRLGIKRRKILPWKKDTLKDDYKATVLTDIPKFDSFTVDPSNLEYKETIERSYNLYSRLPSDPVNHKVEEQNIPHTLNFIKHIFGDQYELGLKYFKVLYERPKQVLPVLVLVSKERQTGKSTFIEYVHTVFGDNFTLINPQDISNQFNSGYAWKNIIAIDETVLEKKESIEKIKALATAKTISVNQKFVQNYTIPFYGKIIMATNMEHNFMRIDEEEIRFWIRKIKRPDKIDVDIEVNLKNEIPLFLKYLRQLPEVDYSRSRMVFTQEEIANDNLLRVKEESFSSLRKDLLINLEEYFNENAIIEEFMATPKDIKRRWYSNDNNINAAYIKNVLNEELKVKKALFCRYAPFSDTDSKPGTPYIFSRKEFCKNDSEPIDSFVKTQNVQINTETAPF